MKAGPSGWSKDRAEFFCPGLFKMEKQPSLCTIACERPELLALSEALSSALALWPPS